MQMLCLRGKNFNLDPDELKNSSIVSKSNPLFKSSLLFETPFFPSQITMMKKRKSKKNSTIESISNCSGTTMSNKFSVFDFTIEDESTEAHAERLMAKFNNNTNDKYNFLTCFAKGSKTQQNDYGNKLLVIDVDDSLADDRSIQLDGTLSSSSSDYILSATSPEQLDFKCYSDGAKSCSPRARQPGDSLTDKKRTCFDSTLPQSLTDVKVLDVDSDDDLRIGLRSSSSIARAENEGSLEEQPFEYGVNTSDIETMVVVIPNYVKFGNTYYTKCLLTFSCKSIKLEGSPPWQTKEPCCHEWPISNIVNIEHEFCETVKVAVVTFKLICNEGNTAEISSKAAGMVKLEFVVSNDTHWSEKLEEIKSLDMKYKISWSTVESEYSSNQPFEDLIYPDRDPDAISIRSRDVEVLQPKTFINDTIIDFYIKYLANKTNPKEQHRFYFFNTFFFQKLACLDRGSSRTWEGRKAFQRVRKWTRNVNIFEKDYIFIPVNSSLHWSLIVICHPGEVENLRDEEMGELYKKPCILHMDSIKGSHTGLQNLIKGYLWEEWKDRHWELAEDISAKFFNLPFVALELPQQENLFDCGLFLLHYAELFLEQVPSNFNLTTLNECPNFLKKNWFPPDEVSLRKRDHIRNLICKIVRENAKKDAPYVNNQNGISREPIGSIISGQQTFGESKFVHGDSMHPSIFQMVSMEQYNNPTFPIEGAVGEQVASPEDEANSHEDTKSLIILSSPSSLRVVETKSSLETSRSSGGAFQIISDEQIEEDWVPEVATHSGNEDKCEYSSMSFAELAACVVEDSEDENERQDISNTGNPPSCRDKFPASCYREAESTTRISHRMNPVQFISATEEKKSAKKRRSSSYSEEQREITIL
ncbi:probable ubiquitin-like-specific protease 2A isoform X1 [Olea europaea subsp. europaea]|uniref:Probable ubiquitin-like-specific protease 2A isoform X1 n=1 Tax=Olea europaea subsp. europaea TaxID=158383 RepID=A0A8S0RLJ8_OLEEU|nr:probable ubiquitin-like-specific protease 2A isoform X1 [Olea europaea subsp. europaea]